MHTLLAHITTFVLSLADLNKYQIGGVVFLALIIIKEVFVYLKGETKQILKTVEEIKIHLLDFKQAESPINEVCNFVRQHMKTMDELRLHLKQTDEMYRWHDKEDSDGVKVWYVRSSLEKTFEKLTDTLEKQEQLMAAIIEKLSMGNRSAAIEKDKTQE